MAPVERVAWYGGTYLPESQVRIPFRDAGATRGEAAYDSARTFDGRVFRLRSHLERLWRSLAYLRIEPPVPMSVVEEISLEVARRNVEIVGDDVWVTQRVTRGIPAEWGGDGRPSLLVESLPIPFAARAVSFRDGARLLTPTMRRTPPWALSPQAKTVNLLNLVLAGREAVALDPSAWPMLTDENGNLAEGAGANVFVVRGGVLATPQVRYVLDGVTRATVIELARERGITVEERDIGLFDAYTADEIFITSTSLCICPVASLNGVATGVGSVPGPMTKRLQDAFSGLVGMDVVEQYLRRLPTPINDMGSATMGDTL